MIARTLHAWLVGIALLTLLVTGCGTIFATPTPTPVPTITPTPIPTPTPTPTPLPLVDIFQHPTGLFSFDVPVMPFEWQTQNNPLDLAYDYSLTVKSPDSRTYATVTAINAGLPLSQESLDKFVEGWKRQFNLDGVTTRHAVQGGFEVIVLEALGYNYFYTSDGIIAILEVELEQSLFDEYADRFVDIPERMMLDHAKIKQLNPYQPWTTHEDDSPPITMKVPLGWRKIHETDSQFSGRLIFESPDQHMQLIYTILYDMMNVGVHQVLWQEAFSDYNLLWEGDLLGTSAATEHEYNWEGTDASGITVHVFSWESRSGKDLHEWMLAIDKKYLEIFEPTLQLLLFFDPID